LCNLHTAHSAAFCRTWPLNGLGLHLLELMQAEALFGDDASATMNT
jgi:hypothetical protein